jgi:hypothetical protein
MDNRTYRKQIANIIQNVLRVRVPGLKSRARIDAANEAATAVHARMYGANVDGVGSPLWRDMEDSADQAQPNIEAAELAANEPVERGSERNLGGNPRKPAQA